MENDLPTLTILEKRPADLIKIINGLSQGKYFCIIKIIYKPMIQPYGSLWLIPDSKEQKMDVWDGNDIVMDLMLNHRHTDFFIDRKCVKYSGHHF